MVGYADTTTYNAALYCRLTRDDGNLSESSSISTQKELLARYAREHGIINTSYCIEIYSPRMIQFNFATVA